MGRLARIQLLVILLMLCGSLQGCQSWLKRAAWRPPDVVRAATIDRRSTWASAEAAYAQALAREARGDASCVDDFFLAATLAWPEVERRICVCGTASGRAAEIYHSSLTKLISTGTRFCRLDPKRGLNIRTAEGYTSVPTSFHEFPWQPEDFDQLIPVGEYSTKELNQSYSCPGLGAAALAIHCRRTHEAFRREQQVFAVSALLRPVPAESASAACRFVLELYDPLRISEINAAGRRVSLTRDITAPIVYVLSKADREYFTGFLQPGSSTDDSGLFMIEPYQRGKIPVVFVHGLLSDRFTWANLANEIRARPELLQQYQLWGYEYATGEPFLKSAAVLRQQLEEAQLQLDPTRSDKAMSRIVLVGHSMGGLVSKLQVAYSGNQLWESVSCRPLESIVTSPTTRAQLANAFFFAPSPMISRVVFVGTPHRGSPWAQRPIGRLGSKLVTEPSSLEDAHRQLIRDNPDTFSREFTRRIPTSIDLLEPNSPLLHAVDRLPLEPRVRLHSIVGSGYWMLGAGDSDTVVPVWSARKSGVITEKFIAAKHMKLHQDPAGIDELLGILRQHLWNFEAENSQNGGRDHFREIISAGW